MATNVEPELQSLGERLKQRLLELDQQLAPLQTERTRLSAQLELIERALSVEKTDRSTTNSTAIGNTGMGGPGETVPAVVAQILEQAGCPLHISEIRNRYLATGRSIPGRGVESNLLVYMVRDPKFVRVTKGTYALSSSASAVAEVQHQRGNKVRRRRRRSKSR